MNWKIAISFDKLTYTSLFQYSYSKCRIFFKIPFRIIGIEKQKDNSAGIKRVSDLQIPVFVAALSVLRSA